MVEMKMSKSCHIFLFHLKKFRKLRQLPLIPAHSLKPPSKLAVRKTPTLPEQAKNQTILMHPSILVT